MALAAGLVTRGYGETGASIVTRGFSVGAAVVSTPSIRQPTNVTLPAASLSRGVTLSDTGERTITITNGAS